MASTDAAPASGGAAVRAASPADAAAAAPVAANAAYDNFALCAPFMDPHLLFPWLTFLEQLGVRARSRPRSCARACAAAAAAPPRRRRADSI